MLSLTVLQGRWLSKEGLQSKISKFAWVQMKRPMKSRRLVIVEGIGQSAITFASSDSDFMPYAEKIWPRNYTSLRAMHAFVVLMTNPWRWRRWNTARKCFRCSWYFETWKLLWYQQRLLNEVARETDLLCERKRFRSVVWWVSKSFWKYFVMWASCCSTSVEFDPWIFANDVAPKWCPWECLNKSVLNGF